MPAAGASLARGRTRRGALSTGGLRDELRSFARGSVEALDRLAESNEGVRRARPVLLATVARGSRAARRARTVGPALRPRPVLDEAFYRAVAAGRRLCARRSLTLVAAAVGQGLDVSLSLRGSRVSSGAVTALALRAPAGRRAGPAGRSRSVPATVVRSGTSVRVAASLPPEHFAAPGATWLLEAVGPRGAVPVAVPRRAALVHRWAGAANAGPPWPARLSCDRRGRLVVRAAVSAPQGAAGSAEHEVHVGLNTVTIAWPGNAPELGMVRQGNPAEVTEVAASTGRDGRRRARIGAAHLLVDPPARWDLCLRGAAGTWVPLARDPGEYPPLADVVRFDAFPVTAQGRAPLRARVFYTAANTLAIRVEAT